MNSLLYNTSVMAESDFAIMAGVLVVSVIIVAILAVLKKKGRFPLCRDVDK